MLNLSVRPRGRIRSIGGVRRLDDGSAQFYDWFFDCIGQDVDGACYKDGELKTAAGWTTEELHAIAHGSPCVTGGCPLR